MKMAQKRVYVYTKAHTGQGAIQGWREDPALEMSLFF